MVLVVVLATTDTSAAADAEVPVDDVGVGEVLVAADDTVEVVVEVSAGEDDAG